jgi:predicted  nucleic acid-binding Zn-ribbon protein
MSGRYLELLLELQELDLAIDRLSYARVNLPERKQVESHKAKLEQFRDTEGQVVARRYELMLEQEQLEEAISATRKRIEAFEKRLYEDKSIASRDLEAMAKELSSLKEHQLSLEDKELAIMEDLEPMDKKLVEIHEQINSAERDLGVLSDLVAQKEALMDAELEVLREQRSRMAGQIPSNLLTLYERQRNRANGVGASRLAGRRCGGCQLELSAVEYERVIKAPEEEVVTCEQCGCILVR